MLEWTISGWIVSGLLGFMSGIVAERYIGRIDRRRGRVRRQRGAGLEVDEDTTKVIRIRKLKKRKGE